MDLKKYPPSSLLTKATEIMRVLFANGAAGVTPTEISLGVKQSQPYVTQQLGQLANLGWAEEIGETGRWRPGVRISQMAISLLNSIDREETSLTDFRQRVTRHHK